MDGRCGSPAAANFGCFARLSCLADRGQIPRPVWRRCLLSKDVEIAAVGPNLVGDALWVVPLIEHRLDLIHQLRSGPPDLRSMSVIGMLRQPSCRQCQALFEHATACTRSG